MEGGVLGCRQAGSGLAAATLIQGRGCILASEQPPPGLPLATLKHHYFPLCEVQADSSEVRPYVAPSSLNVRSECVTQGEKAAAGSICGRARGRQCSSRPYIHPEDQRRSHELPGALGSPPLTKLSYKATGNDIRTRRLQAVFRNLPYIQLSALRA